MPLKTLGGLEFKLEKQQGSETTTDSYLQKPKKKTALKHLDKYAKKHAEKVAKKEQAKLTFTRSKPLALLTYLSLEGEQNRSFMAKLIWGNAKKPFNSLAQAIDQLVRFLPETIEKTDSRVKALVSSDASDFRDAVKEERYLDAIELYQGDFLGGNYPSNITFDFEEWLDEMSDVLAEEAQIALCRQAEIDLVEETLRSKDLTEQAYKTFERTQVGEANLPLLLALLQHHGSVYASKVAQVLEEYDLGLDEVELDFEKGSRIQAETQADSSSKASGEAADIAGLTTQEMPAGKEIKNEVPAGAEVIGHVLPVYASEFFGRKEELQNLQHMLQQPECQLLTLNGPGGMGKTRLATELIHILQQKKSFESVSFVRLEPQNNPEQLANTIAQSLRLSLDASTDAIQQVITFLQGKKHFMTLDNFEHLLTPESAQVIAKLLDGCPDLRALITTRERLEIGQEWLVTIGVLNHPTRIHESLADAESFEAIKLFINRAKRNNIRFQLNEGNSATVQELVMKTAGLPLAIELAASWIQALPPEAILDELKNGLEILSSTAHTEKHQSIEITFEHSWKRLSETEQNVLQALSVFKDGFTKEAATIVTDVSFLQLKHLINKSLLHTTESGRYILHPLLTDYLDAKLQASGLKLEVQAKHSEYYMEYFSSVAKGFRTAKEGEALDAVELEIENIKPAWLFACEQEETVESSLAWELRRFFDARNQQISGTELFTEMAELRTVKAQSNLHGLALAAKAWLLMIMSQNSLAKRIADEARAIVSESEDISTKLNVVNTQGSIAKNSAEYEIAINFYNEAIELAKKEEGQYRLATYLTNLATVEKELGDFEGAHLTLQKALSIAELQDDEADLCNTILALGNLLNTLGEHKEAKAYYQKALHYSEHHRLEQDLPIILSNLANVNFELGLFDESESYCEKVLNVLTGESNQRLKSAVHSTLGKIAVERKQYDKAKSCYDQALTIALDFDLTIYLVRALTLYIVLSLKDEVRNDDVVSNDLQQWLQVISNHPKIELQYKEITKKHIKQHNLQLESLEIDETLTVEGIANILLKK